MEEIKKSAIAQIPEDMYVLSETVVSDGQQVKLKTIGETSEKAFYEAQKSIPTNASIIEQKLLEDYKIKILLIDADDEHSARSKAEKNISANEIVKNFRLISIAKTGFLGIGK